MEKNDEPIIGIDLGTTRCCVATYRKNHAEVIPNDLGERTTPSIVSFTENQIVVGESARRKMQRNSKNTIYDSKRLIGRKFKDPIVQEIFKNTPTKSRICFRILKECEKHDRFRERRNI